MPEQRMVPVELLEDCIREAGYVENYGLILRLRAIIDGPGVKPVAPFAYTYEEDGETYFAHPQGHVPPEAKPLYLAAPSAPAPAETMRDAVRDAIAAALGDAYDCTRVWDAWNVGTMTRDDFVLVCDDESRLYEIADAAISAILAAPQPPVTAKTSAVARPLVDNPDGRN